MTHTENSVLVYAIFFGLLLIGLAVAIDTDSLYLVWCKFVIPCHNYNPNQAPASAYPPTTIKNTAPIDQNAFSQNSLRLRILICS